MPAKKRGRPRNIEALAKAAEERFKPIQLPAAVDCLQTAAVQERLNAATESVNNVLLTMELARAVDRDLKQKEVRGRLLETHVDLLRAAIAFAGAGLDTSLKELIRTTIREVWKRNELSRNKFRDFVVSHLAPAGGAVSPARLADVLTSARDVHDQLLDEYEKSLTGGSLQSAQQVNVVCGALGIDRRELRERMKDGSVLDRMFRARNEIIHELDLTTAGRRSRKLETAREYASEALAVTQEIVNAVAAQLGGAA